MPDQAVGVLFHLEETMPFCADQTIVVRNLYSDNVNDTETEISTILVGCSVNAKTVASATSAGLAAASIIQIRIFAGSHTRAATQSVRAALVPADDKFVAPLAWAAQSAVSAAETWTLRPGDKIEVAGETKTILAVHDNRQGRRFPHWYVEAH